MMRSMVRSFVLICTAASPIVTVRQTPASHTVLNFTQVIRILCMVDSNDILARELRAADGVSSCTGALVEPPMHATRLGGQLSPP